MGRLSQRQQFVQQTLNQVSRGGSSSPNPHQGGFWNQGLVTQPGVGFQQLPGVGLQQMPPDLETAWIILLQLGEFFSK